jgi:hypothetical protein
LDRLGDLTAAIQESCQLQPHLTTLEQHSPISRRSTEPIIIVIFSHILFPHSSNRLLAQWKQCHSAGVPATLQLPLYESTESRKDHMCRRENGRSSNRVVELKSLAPPDVAFRATPQRLQPQIDRIGWLMSQVFDDSSMPIWDRHNLLKHNVLDGSSRVSERLYYQIKSNHLTHCLLAQKLGLAWESLHWS